MIGPDGTILREYQNVSPGDQAETVLDYFRKSPDLAQPDQFTDDRSISEVEVEGAGKGSKKGEQRKMDDQHNEIESGEAREVAMVKPQAATGDQLSGTEVGSVRPAISKSGDSAPGSLSPAAEKWPKVEPGQVYPSQNGNGPSLVFALGTLGYDFGSEARRDSIAQHMEGNPNDPNQLLAYLDDNPSDAAAIIWTLNLDAIPIYAIQPQGPFANEVYQRLRQFLREQATEGVERISIAGVLIGKAQLMSSQTVPVIWPELRCMYSWTTAALVEAVCGKPPSKSADAQEREAYSQKAEAVVNFLQRVYDELRNLGVTSQERAMNYAASNIANAKNIFESALKMKLELHSIEVVPSPICRPGSDCWDVKLIFFDPENVLRAKRVYSFTVDVSDVCPVMVGQIRSWSMP